MKPGVIVTTRPRSEPKNGIPQGTAFEVLPSTYTCPVCGKAKIEKTMFSPLDVPSGRYRCIACGYVYDPEKRRAKERDNTGYCI
ncbi:MAG: rubredoxin [Methanoregulaceae archaeon]|nr:rubredoxin [Methanoregulaceae archaeon]MCU0628182.1 rubredoxin [Methanoregulaceae archaeon]